MDYCKGSIGRVFAVRVDHGEDMLAGLSGLAVKENIRSAFFMMLGAMKNAELVIGLVIGPEGKVVPPTVVHRSVVKIRRSTRDHRCRQYFLR